MSQEVRLKSAEVHMGLITVIGEDSDTSDDEEQGNGDRERVCSPLLGSGAVTLVACADIVTFEMCYFAGYSPGAWSDRCTVVRACWSCDPASL